MPTVLAVFLLMFVLLKLVTVKTCLSVLLTLPILAMHFYAGIIYDILCPLRTRHRLLLWCRYAR